MNLNKNKLKNRCFISKNILTGHKLSMKLMDRDADMDITSISLDSLIKST